jgi:hypothetical protein
MQQARLISKSKTYKVKIMSIKLKQKIKLKLKPKNKGEQSDVVDVITHGSNKGKSLAGSSKNDTPPMYTTANAFIKQSIKDDFKQSKENIKDKSNRVLAKGHDKLHILRTKQASTAQLNEQIEIAANNIEKKFNQEQTFSNDVSFSQALDSLIKPKEQIVKEDNKDSKYGEYKKHYEHAHDEHGMLMLRKIAKKTIKLQYTKDELKENTGKKFKSSDILEFIECVDISKLNIAQQNKLNQIKDGAERKLFNSFTPHNDTNEAVYFLQTLPIKQDEQYIEIAAIKNMQQKRFDDGRFVYTGAFTKLMEIGSKGNKNKRHTTQLTQAKKSIIQAIESLENIDGMSNLQQKIAFGQFLKLVNNSGFRQAILMNADMTLALQTIIQKYASNPNLQKQIKDFAYDNFTNGIVDEGRDSEQTDAYMALFAPKDERKMQVWLTSGSANYQKDARKRILKRAVAQGVAPAAILTVFSGSTARMTVAKAIKTVPAIIVGTRVAFALAVQTNGPVQQKIADYEVKVKGGQKATKYEKTKIVATSLVRPVSQGLVTGFALFGLRAGAVLGFTAALGNPASGAVAASGFFAALGASMLGITPLAYAAGKKELKQSMLDNLNIED